MTDVGTLKTKIEVDTQELDAAIAALELAVTLTNQPQFITCVIITFILGVGTGLLLASFA